MKVAVFFLTMSLFMNFSHATGTGKIAFSLNGKALRTLDLAELQKEVGSENVSLIEPHLLKAKTFSSIP